MKEPPWQNEIKDEAIAKGMKFQLKWGVNRNEILNEAPTIDESKSPEK